MHRIVLVNFVFHPKLNFTAGGRRNLVKTTPFMADLGAKDESFAQSSISRFLIY